MSVEQLRAIHRELEEASANPPKSQEEGRVRVDRMMSAFQPPAALHWTKAEFGGVPALVGAPEHVQPTRTLLYFHGGGFGVGSASAFRGLAGSLAARAGARVVVAKYRLAPEHRFPAAHEDAVRCYRALAIQQDPGSILLGGDSAGANLALSALIAARDAGDPLPAGAVLLCPWFDLALRGESIASKAQMDRFLSPGLLHHAAEAYLGSQSADAPLASPLYAPLHDLPPLCVQAASADILLDDALRFAARAARADVHVDLTVWSGMFHVWHAFAHRLEEGEQAIAQAASFMRRVWHIDAACPNGTTPGDGAAAG